MPPQPACPIILSASFAPLQTRDEVRVLSLLSHPNIVSYHECFHEDSRQFIVMEFCEVGAGGVKDMQVLWGGRVGE